MWKEVISKLRDPFPGRLILLTATPERTQPEAFYSGPECQQGAEVCGHCVVRKEAGDNLLQPIALLGNRPMHLPSQLSFDLLEFRNHAITSGLPMKSYAGFWVMRRSGGAICRHFDDLDAVLESDTSD